MHGKTIKNAMQFVGSIFANIRLRQAESVILAAAEEVAGQDIHMAMSGVAGADSSPAATAAIFSSESFNPGMSGMRI